MPGWHSGADSRGGPAGWHDGRAGDNTGDTMPIERRSASTQIRSILIALVALIFAVTLGYAVVRAATGDTGANSRENRAVGGVWNSGEARSKMDSIAEDGPILLPDPTGSQKTPIYISHVGQDYKSGWYAFEAVPEGRTADCTLIWNNDDEHFTNKCGDETWDATGEGMRQFQAKVDKEGDLIIDFSPEDDDAEADTSTEADADTDADTDAE